MKKRREEFFQRLYEDCYEDLYRYIAKMNTDRRMIEDILQETFYEAYRKLDVLIEHENPRGFLYITARNKTYKICQKRQLLDSREVALEGVAEPYVEDEYGNCFDEWKRVLSKEELEILKRYYQEGYTLEEIAQNKSISKGALKMRLQRVYQKIRKQRQE